MNNIKFKISNIKDQKLIKKQLKYAGLKNDEIDFKDKLLFIATQDKKYVGFIGFNIFNKYPCIEYFFINPVFRGKKIYIDFIRFYYDFLKSYGFKQTIVDVKKGSKFKYLNNFVKKFLKQEPYYENEKSYLYNISIGEK